MKSEETEKIVFLTLIAKRERREELLSALSESGIHLVNTSYGRGFVDTGYLGKAFGLAKEARQAVLTCVSSQSKAYAFLKRLAKDYGFNNPDTGIAFTIPIEKIVY